MKEDERARSVLEYQITGIFNNEGILGFLVYLAIFGVVRVNREQNPDGITIKLDDGTFQKILAKAKVSLRNPSGSDRELVDAFLRQQAINFIS